MKKILFLTVCLLAVQVYAQTPAIEWQKNLGGTGEDVATAVHQTADGGYIVAGYSSSTNGDVNNPHGDADYWVIKLSSNGSVQWEKSLGGSGEDWAAPVRQTPDGGYIVAGYSSSDDGDVSVNYGGKDYWVVKLDDAGSIEWEKSLGGSDDDIATDLLTTPDGGYIVAGYSYSDDGDLSLNNGGRDCWIVKLNSEGAIQWQKSLGGSGDDAAYSIHPTSDGGYVIAGPSDSNDGDLSENHGGNDYWIVKLDGYGNMQWQKSLGGTGEDIAYSIQQTADGGYIIAGESSSNNGDVTGNHGVIDAWIVKLDDSGNIAWQKAFGGSGPDAAVSIRQASDGTYIFSGYTQSYNGDVSGNHGGYGDCWVVKLNEDGTLQWQKALGGTSSDLGLFNSLTDDGGFIVAGASMSNNGDLSGNHGDLDYWIIKLSAEPTAIDEISSPGDFTASPNPVGDILTLDGIAANKDFVITNILGETVFKATAQSNHEVIDLSGLPTGIYLITSDGMMTKKITKR